jgi:hypothetical protein
MHLLSKHITAVKIIKGHKGECGNLSTHKKTRNHQMMIPGYIKIFGSVLLSRSASRAVPSAQKSLTSVFGMGTGVSSLLLPPKKRLTFSGVTI